MIAPLLSRLRNCDGQLVYDNNHPMISGTTTMPISTKIQSDLFIIALLL